MHPQAFNKLVEGLADAVFVVSKPRRAITYANSAACEMFGYRSDQLLGSTTGFLHVDAESAQHFHELTSSVLARQQHFRGEFRMRRANGEVFPTQHMVSLFSGEEDEEFAVSVVRDISGEKQREAELQESESRFRQIAENLSEVFWISNPAKTRMEYVSPAYENIWGVSVESLYQDPKSFLDRIHPEDRTRVKALLSRQTIGAYEASYRIVRPDGDVRWIWDRSVPISNDRGEIYRVVGIAEDITRLKRHEEELLQSRKMDALGHLTGGIAHDFNNMLTVIMGNMELLAETLDPSSIEARLASQALVAGERARDLTNRLLTFARRDAVRKERLDLNELAEQMRVLISRTLGENIEIQLNLVQDSWPVVADRSQIEASLLNLAVNARDAMPDGGVIKMLIDNRSLGAEHPDRPASLLPGDYVEILFSDTGHGIDPDILDRVFDPFFTTKSIGKGTGMGLSMAFATFRESGGYIGVESRPGHGATFRLLLPRCEDLDQVSGADPGSIPAQRVDELILVVEDEPMVRSMLVKQLGRLGYRVLQAGNGSEALGIIESEPGIDLLFSDVMMPGELNGPQLLVEARRIRPGMKAVFCSGYGAEDALRRVHLPASIPVLSKPFTMDQLTTAVRSALDG